MPEIGADAGCRVARQLAVLVLLSVQGALVAWVGVRTSPTCDEVGHLPAGMYVWHFGRFDVYRVNPPLVRSLAALPVVLLNPRTEWRAYQSGHNGRPEWQMGKELIRVNDDSGHPWFWYFVVARWAVIPLSLVGGYICYRWASELYGHASGLLALVLWCSSPNVLGWASTICPDAATAALGVAACYVFWRWLQRPTWPRALASGVMLGIVELTKFTWIILIPLWPVLWIAWQLGNREDRCRTAEQSQAGVERRATLGRESQQMATILLVGLYIINTGYGFEGSFQRLDEFTFLSRTLAEEDSMADGGTGGNRFADTWLGIVPVPLPMNFVGGIDLQKLDFEEGKPSYLRGEWKHGGWWYYYLYAAIVKIPLGTWALGLLALGLTIGSLGRSNGSTSDIPAEGRGKGYPAGWKNELVLLLPAVVVLVLVSSQTGFSHHFRYVLPCFPFVFIWISKVGRSITLRHWSVAAILWSVGSSLYYFPHSMSYFNELVGGPTGGHYHLINSSVDWGQDLWYLRRWLDEHPEARTLHMGYMGFVHPRRFGIEYEPPPPGPRPGMRYTEADADLGQLGPRPGWYAMSIHRIHSVTTNFRYAFVPANWLKLHFFI